jgi:hypothetical protein
LIQTFYPDVSKVDLVLHMLRWLYSNVSSVSSVFRRMLQKFYLDVLKVYLVLQVIVHLLLLVCRRGSRVDA